MVEEWLIKFTIGDFPIALILVTCIFVMMIIEMVITLTVGIISKFRNGPFFTIFDGSHLPVWAEKLLKITTLSSGKITNIGFAALWFVLLGVALKFGGYSWLLLVSYTLVVCWELQSSKRMKARFKEASEKS